MSLAIATRNSRKRALKMLKLTCAWSIGCLATSSVVVAQENLLRIPAPPPVGSGLPVNLETPSGDAGQDEKTAQELASKLNSDGSGVKKDADREANAPASSSARSAKPASTKEPLVLPSLGTPNTSIQGIGTGATPEDRVSGRLPAGRTLPFGNERYGDWILGPKTWTAPVFCHQPTYFEDVMLERHGHERCPPLQPLLSGVRFYSDIVLMPYNAYLNPPLRDISSAGYYRPGTSVSGLRQRPTYDKGAIRFQLLTTGTAVLAAQP